MKCALIGEKLGHSFSKEIHEALGKYEYEYIELTPDEVEPFISKREFNGLNITIPYKQSVMPLLDEISETAREIGAVNTIVNRNGRLIGYNTDYGGMKLLIERTGINLSGKKVFIAGTGGTSSTAAKICQNLGASEVVIASRSGRNGALRYEDAYRMHGDAALLINTTPAGMHPDTDSVPIMLDCFTQAEGVVDVIYNPLQTRLIREAREKGIRAENGLYMLVAQAVLASKLFTGESTDEIETVAETKTAAERNTVAATAVPTEEIQKTIEGIYKELIKKKRSIVLTGMPRSGKSTLGKMLAEKLGRELVETDEKIVAEVGMPIAQIFSKYGEEHFRDIESRILKKVSQRSGLVISTGGGAVLRKENVDSLRMNGIIVFLDRSLEKLLPSGSRPLADTAEKIRRLYEERLPIYIRTADVRVKIEGTEEQSLERIMGVLE